MKKLLNNKTAKTFLGYSFLFLITVVFIVLFVRDANISSFFDSVENRTFDIRQTLIAKSGFKKVNKDIVIITVDDASYEYLLGKYGEWPIPRDVYAQLINYLEKQKPQTIAFDLMFIKSLKSKNNADMALVNAISRHDNVYTSMNFDNQEYDVRKPVNLPKDLRVNVKNDSKVSFKDVTYTNCRSILPQILSSTKNVGLINVSRSDDGILRKVPPFMVYKGDIYPHLTLLVGLKYLQNKENLKINDFHINKKGDLELGKRIIPLERDAGAVLNWYGPTGTFTQVPLYKVVQAMQDGKPLDYNFKNKIIYIGTTAVSLYDTKSIPIDKLYPGVEVHATYMNNIIDNNFIKKIPKAVNALISIALGLFIGFVVMRSASTVFALFTTVFTTLGYVILTYYLMKFFNLWVNIIFPVAVILFVFAFAYIIKYIMKSRDFEHQYRLATTDGLTELYNHRYFQEQMIQQVENCKRYNTSFSLILIDIDFFKKFNDTFGHQSGDAVLRQVSQKLKRNVRSTDIVCRYGGEEMSIILPNTDKKDAIVTAQKICQTIAEKPFKLANDKESNVTISLGVSTYPEDGESADSLIASADKRLYKAKNNGRNQAVFE